MAVETPALTAVMARLEQPEINLAAYGGVVFPLALIIESPIIMLLAASTALCKDLGSYQRVRRFMMTAGAALTGLHVLVAFTPLYYVVVETILKVPGPIVEPARTGMMIMTPWTWSIAYRRFNQGVLIRFGHSRLVGIGTVIRLSADGVVLLLGYLLGSVAGIVVATSAIVAGVISEAVYSGRVVRPVVNGPLHQSKVITPALTWQAFYAFYVPLAMTSLLTLLANPIGSAALSRMPQALASLAVWSVVTGLLFLFRSMGVSYNEVVVALLDERYSSPSLRQFAFFLAGATSLGLFVIAATPLSNFYFSAISALPQHLASLAKMGLWFTIPLPALSVLQSWYQGTILHGGRTRGISEAVMVYLISSIVTLGAGVVWGGAPGLFVGLASLTICTAIQTLWLWFRSRSVLEQVRRRDAATGLI
jgi:hypothetical protein